jgi:predicted ester cyclase
MLLKQIRFFSPEYIDHQKPSDWAIDSPEEFKQIVAIARTYLPNLQVTIEDVLGEGDRIAARLQWHSRSPTGKHIQRETLEILRFSGNIVAEHWGAESWRLEHDGEA